MEFLGFMALVYMVRKHGFLGAFGVLFRMALKFYAYLFGFMVVVILIVGVTGLLGDIFSRGL